VSRTDSTRVTTEQGPQGHPVLRFEHRYDYDVEEVWWALTGDADPVPDESVVEAEAPYLLICTADDDVVRWDLQVEGDGARVLLTLVVGDSARRSLMAANCHAALEQIGDTLDGVPPGTTFDELVEHYARALPAA